MRKTLLALFMASTLSIPNVASASGDTSLFSENELRQFQRNPENAGKFLLRTFESMAPTGSLTQDMQDTYLLLSHNVRRNRLISTFFRFDLDANLVIEKNELERVKAILPIKKLKREFASVQKADELGNNDNNVTIQEMLKYARKVSEEKSGQRNSLDMMRFDLNEDGKVEYPEVVNAIRSVARPKGDGEPCSIPTPSNEAKIIFLSGYEGTSLSNVAIDGPNKVTTAATINIEDGTEPLFIVGSFYDSLIFRFTGDVARVEKFVASSSIGRNIGAIGLQNQQVYFPADKKCLPKYVSDPDLSSGRGMLLNADLGHKLGRDVDSYAISYGIDKVALPSGSFSNRKSQRVSGRDQRSALQNEFNRFSPGGLAKFDPTAVISGGSPVLYDVLPQQAGLLQLVDSGAVYLTSDGYFLIKKPIKRFPAGLAGAHSVTFLLDKGVPRPSGDPGHSSVVDLKTGECLSGSTCRY